MKLADYLKEFRKNNNMTQQDLADKLFVTKQAVSKWETERGTPDLETLKDISKLINVSVDELLGLDGSGAKTNSEAKSLSLVTLFVLLVIASLTLVVSFIFSGNSSEVDHKKEELIKKTETELQTTLPQVEDYGYLDYSNWTYYGNSFLPSSMYYFVFKDEVFFIDSLWLSELDSDMVNVIPVYLGNYLDNYDFFKIIDLTTGTINIINVNDDRVHSYVLYCVDISNKRVIAISFEV